eukprot:CAMPEP_0198132852 /NCGR_PEP_ID=MMETSP1442-20131203/59234_1 /TAXON_ID= /ORGANISM="Craspedostauros australis, Strain CCMP3328" /LENGTH=44 /DNA_ID= /DNA_START= /DNA_END= /DNA_ORIENTATION=
MPDVVRRGATMLVLEVVRILAQRDETVDSCSVSILDGGELIEIV